MYNEKQVIKARYIVTPSMQETGLYRAKSSYQWFNKGQYYFKDTTDKGLDFHGSYPHPMSAAPEFKYGEILEPVALHVVYEGNLFANDTWVDKNGNIHRMEEPVGLRGFSAGFDVLGPSTSPLGLKLNREDLIHFVKKGAFEKGYRLEHGQVIYEIK